MFIIAQSDTRLVSIRGDWMIKASSWPYSLWVAHGHAAQHMLCLLEHANYHHRRRKITQHVVPAARTHVNLTALFLWYFLKLKA